MKVSKKYVEISSGILQCQSCGFAKAEGEDNAHTYFHNAYLRSKNLFGNSLLSFSEYKKLKLELPSILEELKTSDLMYSEVLLDKIYRYGFSLSLRMWDYGKEHPNFKEYQTLLWNTPNFLNFISNHMDVVLLSKYKAENISNRRLYGGELFECYKLKPINVTTSEFLDLSYLDNFVGMSTKAPQEDKSELESETESLKLSDVLDNFIKSGKLNLGTVK